MKVKELIEALQKLDPELNVYKEISIEFGSDTVLDDADPQLSKAYSIPHSKNYEDRMLRAYDKELTFITPDKYTIQDMVLI